MENKFKDVYIGRIIQQKVDEHGLSYAENIHLVEQLNEEYGYWEVE